MQPFVSAFNAHQAPFRAASLLILCLICLVGCKKPAVSETDTKPANNITFDGVEYVLAFKKETDHGTQNRYYPVGQDSDTWTRMISIEEFRNQPDYEAAATKMQSRVKQGNPDALTSISILKNETEEKAMLDFLTWSPKMEVTEFNVVSYKSNPDGPGVIAHHIAMRAFGPEDSRSFSDKILETKQETCEAAAMFGFPKIIR